MGTEPHERAGAIASALEIDDGGARARVGACELGHAATELLRAEEMASSSDCGNTGGKQVRGCGQS
jgi:hypothetical protein